MTKKFESKNTFDFILDMVNSRNTILEGETRFLDEHNKAKEKARKASERAQEKARKEREVKAREHLAKWLKGDDIQTYHLREIPEIYLRGIPKGDAIQVETSWGARVDIKRAKVLYTLLTGDHLKNVKRILGFDIDGYKVVEVSSTFIKIGCHIIMLDEVKRFAKKMKW